MESYSDMCREIIVDELSIVAKGPAASGLIFDRLCTLRPDSTGGNMRI